MPLFGVMSTGKKKKDSKTQKVPFAVKKAVRNVLKHELTNAGYASVHRTFFDV